MIFERFRRRELVRTNYLGASTKFDYGQIVEREGKFYRVTHQKLYRTEPWETIVISGVEVSNQESKPRGCSGATARSWNSAW